MTTSRPTERLYRLAPMQLGMLFHSLSGPDEGMYVVQFACELPPGVDLSAFNRAWQSVVDRHDVLRTCFLWEGLSEPLQKVCEDIPIQIDIQDWTGVPGAGEGGLLKSYLLHERRRGFDLSTAPLIRFAIIKMARERNLFLWTYSHMLLDGRSRLKVMKEVSLFYDAYCSNQNLELPRPPAYADYIDWFYRQDLSDAEENWRKVLGTFTTPVTVDLPRRSGEGQSGDSYQTVRLKLSAEVNASLQQLAQSTKLTVNWIVQAAWGVLLARYSGEEDVVYGETRAGRRSDYEEVGSVVGLVMNTVPIRLQATATKAFIELLQEVRDQHVQMRSHESTPLTRIREASGINRRAELFQSIVMFEEYDTRATLQREGCALWRGAISRFSPVHYPLALVGYIKPDLSIKLDYDGRVYADETMERLAGHLTALLEGVVKDPHARIADLPFLTNAERKQIVCDWNATEAEYPRERCVHELFEEQVEQTPDAVAVVAEDAALSYGELNRRANQLAHHLRELGVGPDERVAVCLERSLEMIVGLLGVLKAGGAYVPLDPAYPMERLRYMVEDSAPVVLLKEGHREGPFSGSENGPRVVDLTGPAVAWSNQPDSNPEPAGIGLTSRQLAYVIYTSGSTGTPKGVVIEHHSLVNLICWHCASFELKSGMRSSSVASFGFDAATWEIWPPLCVGATLLLPSPMEARDPEALLAWWSKKKPDVSFLPTPIAEFAFAQGIINPLQRTLLVGGDRLHQLPVKALPFALVNNYGPTETTVVATSGLVELSAEVPSIGRPIANAQVYILDKYQHPVPIGVQGELYIGGAGVGRGYLNRPGRTAERFVVDPFSAEAGARMYRTGDVGRWLADGTIEFLGRNDNQVKIRGFRIELGEIEARLAEYEGVKEVVVVVQGEAAGEKRLVAYYTCVEGRESEIGAEVLRSHLYTKLPKYMVPAAYVRLERIPLTPNGKVDRKGLPVPDGDAYGVRGFEAPVGETETALARIWADVLKVERVGRYDEFFELGGHSLRAMRLVSQLRQALGMEVAISELFAHPVLSDFARVVGSAAQTTVAMITPVPRGEPLPLSFAQQRLWFLAQMEGVSEAYHIFYGWRLKGQLNYAALRQALDRIVGRHEALRSTFAANNGEPRQWIHSAAESVFHLVEQDLQEQLDAEQELERVVAQEASAGFDLASGPLIRGRLLRLGEEEQALLITMHHIVADGWSMELLMHELSVLYGAYERGEEDPLPELSLQYADYAVWQRQWMEGAVWRKQAEYWERRLAGAPALLELPTDHGRPAEQEYGGGWVKLELEEELTRDLNELSKQQGTTLYMTLLAGWGALLARLSGQEDIVVGAPAANRGRMEIEGLIGFFVNTLALRLQVSGSLTVSELLSGVKEQVLAGQLHQDIPFEQVVEIVGPVRSLSHSPIFQVMFAWQSAAEAVLELPRLELEKLESTQLVAKFDLSLSLQEVGDRIVGGLKYATALFEQATVERYAEYFRRILKAVVANPESCIRELPLLSEGERHELIVEWNATEAEYPRERCVHELFEEQVEQAPDAVAVVAEDVTLSYGELNRRANQLAHQLRELGVLPGERVALLLERSAGLVVAQLAVLKSGAAYVPIDPTFPEERQAMMVRDSGAEVVITSAGRRLSEGLAVRWVELGEQGEGEWSETNPGIETSSEITAYVMYTSGSTGTPKGVMVPHRAIGRLVLNCGYVSFNKEDRVAFASNPAFDASTMEVWGALLNGGSTVVVEREQVLEAGEFGASLRRHGVSVLFMTTALMNQYAERLGETLGGLRYLIVGGEVLDPRVMGGILRGAAPRHLLSAYGPTETTTFASTHEIREVTKKNIPLGRPIGNTQVYILDGNWEPVPVGARGELYIGGAGVAEGYLNRPELTAERFVVDPFSEEVGARMYRTGDLGRWSKEGEIEFEGRNDFQVKIRGFRVELGEIEARLAEYEGVKEVVVVVQGEAAGEKRLVAYYTCVDEAEIGAAELRSHLCTKLPNYMVPAAYVRLEKMPLNPNGKVDRRRLPVPDGDAYAATGYEAPVGELEIKLAVIWQKTLQLDRVGRHDNFYELGGHSILAVRLHSLLQEIDNTLTLADLFVHPTIESLARKIESAGKQTSGHRAICLREGGSEPPLFTVHPANYGYFLRNFAEHLALGFPVYDLPPRPLSDPTEHTVEGMAMRLVQMMRAVQPEGPYRIAGYSGGGPIAYEIATQLIGAEQKVEFVGLFDAHYWPGEHDYTSQVHQTLELYQSDFNHNLLRIIEKAYTMPDQFPRRVSQEDVNEFKLYAATLDLATFLRKCQERLVLPEFYDHFTGPQIHHYLTRNRTIMMALLQYCAHPLPIPVHFFAARESEDITVEGWKSVVPPELLHILRVEGSHQSIMGPANVVGFTRVLSNALREAAETSREKPERNDSPLFSLQSGRQNAATHFWVPGAGATVINFAEVVTHLDRTIPVYGLQPRGPEDEAVPHSTVEAAAEFYVQAINEVYPRGPVHLLGHSFGGLVAFHMAHLLLESGRSVASLIILDKEAPDRPDSVAREYGHTDMLMSWIDDCELVLGHPLGISRADIEWLPEATQRELLHTNLVRVGLMPPRSNPDELRGLLRVFGASIRARYVPGKSYRGPLKLVLVDDPRLDQATNRQRHQKVIKDWKHYAPGLVSVHGPGNHLSMLKTPHAQTLANLIHDGLS